VKTDHCINELVFRLLVKYETIWRLDLMVEGSKAAFEVFRIFLGIATNARIAAATYTSVSPIPSSKRFVAPLVIY
jgi:hypothetical protein